MKFLRFLNDHLEEYLLVFLMVVEVVVVFAQVVTRYVFHSPLAWSEELARYMFIWLVWIGAAYATILGVGVQGLVLLAGLLVRCRLWFAQKEN